jgi:hypothetical protein
VLASGGRGELFVDTLKNKRARTVPLVPALVPIVDRWAEGKTAGAWLFDAPRGGMLSEGNWKRSVGWSAAVKAIGFPRLRVHDLRHTAASVWLGVGADPKVVQRILGHASAAMTMDLYGHLVDQNLWDAAQRFAGGTGTPGTPRGHLAGSAGELQNPRAREMVSDLGVWVEPPVGIEPTTFSLRGGTTPSHGLSTTGFGNTAARSVREIPHEYPSFRATGYATADSVSMPATPACMTEPAPR